MALSSTTSVELTRSAPSRRVGGSSTVTGSRRPRPRDKTHDDHGAPGSAVAARSAGAGSTLELVEGRGDTHLAGRVVQEFSEGRHR